uniref:Tudor domain-containing protein 15 n=1 Tax=Geotrypetes seraphini TaxID=260995 RepID=A0A6P8QV30_GEOSA|nr:tudor domain-containing protein 15 [Geotrypetes seraphini]XP_033791474.1 tudor domain-containing protein 15 [Geotrypetes seraphini]
MDFAHFLPKFKNMNLQISYVECHLKEVLVKFQGRYNAESEFDYHILQTEIQCVPKINDNIDVGEFCLVEDKTFGKWHRGRILDKKDDLYKVFFIDNGKVLDVSAIQVASACGDLFQLPPRIVYGIFSNILPLDQTWSLKALNYFSSLPGLQVEGNVADVLPYQTILLEVPKIINHLIELKLGKYVDGDSFRLIVEMSKESPENLNSQMPDLLKQKISRTDTSLKTNKILSRFQLAIDDLQPHLSVGATERVKITAAFSPERFYCQKLAWIQELQNLTSTMSLQYETISKENGLRCESFGTVCAARRKDGQWHRGVIEQLLFGDQVKIWFMDFGNSETVSSNYVYKLEPQFLLVPMMSFPCTLSCLDNQNEEIMNSQLKKLKQALLGKSVFAQIDLFSTEEYVFHVTLHNEDVKIDSEHCLSDQQLPMFSPNGLAKIFKDTEHKMSENHISQPNASGTKELEEDYPAKGCLKIPCRTVEMKIDSVHVAYVEYVLNPSNFWIRTDTYECEFLAMSRNISEAYSTYGINDNILENPKPGLLCCARYTKDSHYYRAVVVEVLDSKITVYFLDFGNTDTVPFYDVKILLPLFCELPALAMCCTLARAFPVEDIWVKSATDFFKMTVFGKEILVHVLAKQNEKYVVDVHLTETSEKSNVVVLMVQAGFAEYWELKPGRRPPDWNLQNFQIDPRISDLKSKDKSTKGKKIVCIGKMVSSMGNARQNNSSEKPIALSEDHTTSHLNWEHTISKRLGLAAVTNSICSFKQHVFKPGTVLDVTCSHIISPGDFWCQLDSKLAELKTLMKEIQIYYSISNEPYQPGQTACVARYLKDGKWYRASILKQVSVKEVEVMFVDYGYKMTVLVADLQAINDKFLLVEGQAFRCSLYNLIEPFHSEPLTWTKEACREFKSFVNNASSGSLKCTIYALALENHKSLWNIVNLATPFVRVDQFLIDHGHAKPGLSTQLASSMCLHSFYYSSFNLKIGSEEEVHITHIYSPGSFFCQLNKNTKILDKLMIKIGKIGNRMKGQKWEDSRLGVCIAKYFEDENFYRALAYPIKSSSYVMVDFVDFGNKQMVEQYELLPIPEDATEVFFTPMQAIKCYLSDLNEKDFPVAVTKWFEENCIGKPLKAVLVSRNTDGQLAVELYDGRLQINTQIKDLLQVHTVDDGKGQNKDNKLVPKLTNDQNIQPVVDCKTTESFFLKAECKNQSNNELNKINDQIIFKNKKQLLPHTQDMLFQPASDSKNEHDSFENIGLNKEMGSHCEVSDWSTALNSSEHEHFMESTAKHCTKELHKNYEQENDITMPKYADLPQPNIQQNSKRKAFISHVNSPFCFYVQLAEDEDLIIQLADELNKITVSAVQNYSELSTGDIVLAEYAHDLALYRAVIKDVKSVNSFDVEFIDYGNSAVVNNSQIYELQRKFLTIPRFAVPCLLNGVNNIKLDGTWSKEITSYFVEKVTGKSVLCEFLQLHNKQWNVNLITNEKILGDELVQYQQSLELKKTGFVSKQSSLTDHTNLEQQESMVHKTSKEEELLKKSESNKINIAQCTGISNEVPYLRLKRGQLEKVQVLSVSVSGDFHVTFPRSTRRSTHLPLLITKAAKRKDNILAAEHVQEGLQCLTKSEKKLEWYRSEVKKVYKDEKNILVFFMDLGITEKVKKSNIRMLSDDIKDIPRQIITCKWIFIENIGKVSFGNIMNTFTSQEIKILFQSYLESICIWKVEVLIDGKLLMQYLNETTFEAQKTLHRKDTLPFQVVPWAELESCKQYYVFATTVINPSHFYLQLRDFLDAMETLCMLLCDLPEPENMPSLPPEFILIGSHCLVKHVVEDQWYRAEISEVSNNSVFLTLLDLGCTLCIPCYNINMLKIIPEDIARVPRLVYCCSLTGVVPEKEKYWTEEAIHFFQDNLNKDHMVFQFKEYSPELCLEVELMNEKTNLADQMIAAGYAVHPKRSTVCLDAGNGTKIDTNDKEFKEIKKRPILRLPKRDCVDSKILSVKKGNPPIFPFSKKLIFGKQLRINGIQLKKETSSHYATGNTKDALIFEEGRETFSVQPDNLKYKDERWSYGTTELRIPKFNNQ